MAHRTIRTGRATRDKRTTTPPRADRLPAAQQRRLDHLLARANAGRLTPGERQELEAMLEMIDRRSFWMLAQSVLNQVRTRRRPAPKAAAG